MREDTLLQHVYASNRDLPQQVTIPPGDDMGGVKLGGRTVLITVDQVADGVHADLKQASLSKFGRKAITRNLSDVAAMAAKPAGAVVAVCLPREMDERRAKSLFNAMRKTGEAFECPLLGGDISIWDGQLLISVTIFAEPAGIEPVLRRGAQVGDAIYVTGWLGGSIETVSGFTHHLDFTPRVAMARKLAGNRRTRPHCMIDLSDGLARDLGHLCRAAGVSADLIADELPVSSAAEQAARRTGRSVWQHAVGDGEDYELLFTAPPGAIPDMIDGVPIHEIGAIHEADGEPAIRLQLPDGEVADLASLGWEHQT